MKILLFTNILPPYRARFLLKFAAEIQKKSGEFLIYLSKKSEPGRNWNESTGPLEIRTQKTFTLKKNWKHPHGFQEPNYIHIPIDTLLILIKEAPTHLISAEMGMRSFFAALYKIIHPSTRLIIWATLSEHTEKGRSVSRTSFRKILMRFADQVIVNGMSGRRYVESLGVKREQILVLPQTTELSAFQAITKTETQKRTLQILYSGRLIELKGIVPWLRNLNEFLRANQDLAVNVTFLGDGSTRTEIENLDRVSNLQFSFLGEVQYSNLASHYAKADLLVLPTFSDEWGMVVVEALAAGIPVLGSIYSQAVESLIQEGVNGWQFDPLSKTSISNSLEKLKLALESDCWPNPTLIRGSIQHLELNSLVHSLLGFISNHSE